MARPAKVQTITCEICGAQDQTRTGHMASGYLCCSGCFYKLVDSDMSPEALRILLAAPK